MDISVINRFLYLNAYNIIHLACFICYNVSLLNQFGSYCIIIASLRPYLCLYGYLCGYLGYLGSGSIVNRNMQYLYPVLGIFGFIFIQVLTNWNVRCKLQHQNTKT